MKEFVEEYGGIISITIVGLSIISAMWNIIQILSYR